MEDTACVYAARLPGREGRFHEPVPARLDAVVDEVAKAVAELPQSRVVLLGHCSGAIIAFESARTLRRLGVPTLAHLIVVAQTSPQVLALNPPDAEPDASIPPHFRDNPELRELLLPVLAADILMMRNYQYLPAQPLDIPITVIRGNLDTSVAHDEATGWREETSDYMALREVEGADHLFSGDAWLRLEHQVREVLVSTVTGLP
jgi:surfactin synthase thioesterase subunit